MPMSLTSGMAWKNADADIGWRPQAGHTGYVAQQPTLHAPALVRSCVLGTTHPPFFLLPLARGVQEHGAEQLRENEVLRIDAQKNDKWPGNWGRRWVTGLSHSH